MGSDPSFHQVVGVLNLLEHIGSVGRSTSLQLGLLFFHPVLHMHSSVFTSGWEKKEGLKSESGSEHGSAVNVRFCE
jgi:hypothetical protein